MNKSVISFTAWLVLLSAILRVSYATQNKGAITRRQAARNDSSSLYTSPYIDEDEWRDQPLRHRYVHGGFNGTDLRFSFYFPPKDLYKGRFFQPLPAVSGNERLVLSPEALGAIIDDIAPFAFESGAYVVESNQGSLTAFPGLDQTITGFRASGAAATYSRKIAQQMYGSRHPYGYVFGGSGGGFKTISCMENTEVWDAAVPFIIGSPASIPNVFTSQAYAMRLLGSKFPMIVDSIEPGGSGDMYSGLNVEERQALAEVTKMGFPPQAWFRYEKIAVGYTGVFSALLDTLALIDGSYFQDFWTKPGYLGADPPKSLTDARIHHNTSIQRIIFADEARRLGLPVTLPGNLGGGLTNVPAAVILTSLPTGDLQGASLTLTSGPNIGSRFFIAGIVNSTVIIGFGATNLQAVLGLKEGDGLFLDNDLYLASQTYHRHQSPGPEFPVWQQFQSQGKPIYPQRLQLSQLGAALSGTGTAQTGKFRGKMIVIEAGMDEAAFPWQADWYKLQVKKNLGSAIDSRFRLWMVENCMHTSPQKPTPQEPRPVEATRIVSYTPIIQQALRDLINWVEKDLPPPPSTNYTFVDGQLVLPPSGDERKGVQPVTNLSVNGTARANAKVGVAVEFNGTISVPPFGGSVVAAEFDFDGAGAFPVSAPLQLRDGTGRQAVVKASYTFSQPGTYFPVLKGVSARQDLVRGNASAFGRATNLGRVRVVVT
ncbi:hypothetical protein P152DRAFT_514417 [Eremomyces bilateralis CBS 781.70]|uniref:Uncharacterized protein n=1 Tax=Eremomyces bilateralis CBS 781.70 TaxID=1392243 RepID=A0A6G1G374_9PEZI|nr:uncharacterized protein P152DRAFT_514417 [Eremomyces bilateralis CBS 781.70]KAF1812259.1 hypothetical protein P152DRAFT_514417 [Eremomyces bilateralis CBS 781.70]